MDIVSKLIDKRNQGLWDELNDWKPISIEYNSNPWYSCYTSKSHIKIYLNGSIVSPGGFTHELLHILFYKKEFYASRAIERYLNDSCVLAKIFSKQLIDHFGNCLEHIKMLPLYLEMGYHWREFITDATEDKLKTHEISNIRDKMAVSGIYDAAGVDFYIGKYISCKACPNPNFGYDKKLLELQIIEPDLYSILEKLTTTILDYDLNSTDPFSSYYQIISDFVDSMESWCNGKVFFNKIS